MGSKILCKKPTNGIPKAAVASWRDSDGQYYNVEAASVKSLEKAADGLIYQAGMSSAGWEIGTNAICKVPTYPNSGGQTLANAWPALSSGERADVTLSVAQYCRDLTEATSEKLQSATGCGVLEPFLTVDSEPSHPSWKPRPLDSFCRIAAQKYFQRMSTLPPPTIGDRFHFYHADLGPTNIILSKSGAIEAILDWESAGYYPKFWISLKPYRSGGFNLDAPDDSPYAWTDLLESKLSDFGFRLDLKDVEWQKSLDFTYFDLEEFRDATL